MEATSYRGTNKLIIGIVFGVITFWLFAQSMVNVVPAVQKDLGISVGTLNIAISLTALFSGLFIVAAGGLVHFEIHVNDMERAKKFYGEVFGWSFQDWSDYAGMPYFGAVTGSENEPGIDGALMQRRSAPPEANQALNGYACTMGVENFDETEATIMKNGGQVALPKYALPGMAWQGYFLDPEGNIFGIHQPDKNAK